MDEFKKLTLEEQNENWNRLTPAFRSCVSEIYNGTACDDEDYNNGVLDTLEHLFGEHNLSYTLEPKKMLMVEYDKVLSLMQECNSNINLSAGLCRSFEILFGDNYIRAKSNFFDVKSDVITIRSEVKPEHKVGDLVGIRGVDGVYRIEEISETSPFKYRVLFRLGFIDEEDIIPLSNTPNSGELKIQPIENVPFHAADKVKIIGSSTEAGKCFIGEVGEVIDIDSVNHTCFVLFRKSQAWIQWGNLELYSKES